MNISDAQARRWNELAGASQQQDVKVTFNVMKDMVKIGYWCIYTLGFFEIGATVKVVPEAALVSEAWAGEESWSELD